MKIIHKLTLGFLLVSSLVVVVAYFGVSASDSIHNAHYAVEEETIPTIKTLDDMKHAGMIVMMSTHEYIYISSENRTESALLEAEYERIASGKELYARSFKRYEDLVNKFFPEEKESLENIRIAGQKLQNTSSELIELKKQGVSGLKVQEKHEELEEAGRDFFKAIDSALTYEDKEFAERMENLHSSIENTKKTILIVSLLTLISAIAVGAFISTRFSKPILELKNAAVEIGKGKLATRVEIASSDEVGILATCFNQMADRLEQDIVERKQAEEELKKYREHLEELVNERTCELRDSEAKYHTLYESSSDAIMMLDEKGFFDCNSATLRMFGFSTKEEFTKVHPADVSPPYQPDGTDSLTAANNKIAEAFSKGMNRFEWMHRRTNGEEFPAEVLLTAFPLRGKQVLQATVRDITERKRAEEALRQTSDRLQLATRAANVGIWDLDVINNKLVWDDAMYQLYGITPDRFTGAYEAWEAGLHPDDMLRGREEVQMALRGEKEFDTEFRVVWPDKSVHYIKAIGMVQRDASGRAVRMLGTNWDITERRRAEESLRLAKEEAERANMVKTNFLMTMSHELRTPLNAILGFSEMLKQKTSGELNEKQEHFIDNIQTSGNNLLNIVSQILEVVKIENGTLELRIEKIPVPGTVDEVISVIKEKAAKKNVVMVKNIDPQLKHIEADKDKIKQVFINLLENAVKFSKPEGGTVTITAKKEGDMARFSVSDTGIGIKEEDMGKLFQKFTQLETGTTRRYGGTGIGLAVAKQFVELHGGKIRAESKFGEGSTFTFMLPLNAKDEMNFCTRPE